MEARFKLILPRELLAKTKTADPKTIPQIIKKTTAANIWGLWLAGMKHGSDHGQLELKMTGRGLAKFALLDDRSPPSKMQNKRAQDAIWTRVNTLAGNVADTEWAKIQDSLKENIKGDISRSQLQAQINDTLGSKTFAGRAETIARTELTFAYNAGRIETYRANNVESIRRYCIVDERTCEQCAGLNGMVARLDDMAAVMRLQPPSHPRCRCTTGALLDVRQLAEANRQPPPLAQEPWLVGRIIAAIIG